MNYKTYHFKDKDPVIKLLEDAIAVSGMTWGEVAEASGVNVGTLYAWFHGSTRYPRFCTVQAIAIALRHEFRMMEARGAKVVRLKRAA